MKVQETGFFTMDDVRAIEKMNLTAAKEFALSKINAMPNARRENLVKATNVVNRAKNVPALMFSMTNFVLAHPSENLKVI